MLAPTASSKKDVTDVEKSESQSSEADYPNVPESNASLDSQPIMPKSFGIRKSELELAQMTSRWHRFFYFFAIFLGMFIMVTEQFATNVFVGYATNSYKQHSLMSTVTTIGQVAMAASMPFFARASDVFGRLELFVVALIIKTMGTIIQSQAVDIQKYAAGTVFYSIGSSGMVLVWQVSIGDASTLRWRFAALSALCMTSVVTTWSIGEITSSILRAHSWRFGIALWAFTTPLACLPYMLTYLHLIWKSRKTETWQAISMERKEAFLSGSVTATKFHQEAVSTESMFRKLWAKSKLLSIKIVKRLQIILWDMDLIGCLLIGLILGLFLVPLTLAGGVSSKWRQASTIVPLVMGFVAVPIFIVWESKLTKRPLLPFQLMKDRGVWGAFGVSLFSTLISSTPGSYAYPVLLVGMNASVTVATRTPTLNTFVEGLTVPIVGLLLTKVRRTKAFIVLGDFVMLIAMGLFVHFRGSSDGSNGKYYRDGVAAAMCVSGVAQAMFYRLTTTSLQACTNHEYMGPVTAIFGTFITIGSAFGRCISGAIWTQTMYAAIREEMIKLDVDPSLATSAYASPYDFIEDYPWGSEPRRAVSMAYASIQRKLCIVAVCLCVPILFFIMLLRDHRLVDSQNLDDHKAGPEDPEKAVKIAEREKSQIVFKDDDDHILNWLKRIFGLRRKGSKLNSC